MREISYAELNDMEYYNSNYKKEDWENKTQKDFMDFYNSNNITIDATTWVRLNMCSEEMYYKKAFSNQICFIRDDIGNMFFEDSSMDEYGKFSELRQRSIKVDSTHYSKSIEMPVYRIYADGKDDLVITISDNFHGYQVSVESKNFDIDISFTKLFDAESVPRFMYGFNDNRIFESYNKSKRNFSFGIGNHYHLYMIMHQISELWNSTK